jgi:heme-degrading monooxygenase HmoA
MAAEPTTLVDLHVLHFKPTSLSVDPETTPPPALEAATSLLADVAGVASLHLGRRLEDDELTTWVLATTWASRADADAFSASEQWMPFRAALRSAVAAGDAWETVRLGEASAPTGPGILDAPCTEIFTAVGAGEKYWADASAFAASLARAGPGEVASFKGVATARHRGKEGGDGDTVALLLGWESMQAHYDAKAGPGPLIDGINAHLNNGGHGARTMTHVNFKKL